jgi:DNA-binding transcriptional MerR regulator
MNNGLPDQYVRGALRSRLVSKLTGLSHATLQHWHSTELQAASNEPGERGTPRLYSWVDYQRLCVMAALRDQGIPTATIRRAVAFLDDVFPEWWNLSLLPYEGHVRGSAARVHVVVRRNLDVVADVPGGQMSFRDALRDETEDAAHELADALVQLERRGPLFKQSAFSDAVILRPEVNAAQPTLRDTSLETEFIAKYAVRTSVLETARIFRLEEWAVNRAIAFEEAA